MPSEEGRRFHWLKCCCQNNNQDGKNNLNITNFQLSSPKKFIYFKVFIDLNHTCVKKYEKKKNYRKGLPVMHGRGGLGAE